MDQVEAVRSASHANLVPGLARQPGWICPPGRLVRSGFGYRRSVRFALPTLLAAVAAGAIGVVVAHQHWAFAWGALAMIGGVVFLGLAALIVVMIWPGQERGPVLAP